MPTRNATVAVIGAGDFIGTAIAKKFAAEGFTVFAGRRMADKLSTLVKDIEASGGRVFASAKFGLRAVAQSAARELGPKNIHVAHLIIDAGVDTAWVRERIRTQQGEDALANLSPDQLMKPESVAETYWQLYQQPRDAWTFETEIRPFAEKW